MRQILLCVSVFTCMMILPSYVFCENSVEGNMTAYKVTFNEKGDALFEQTENIAPGDIIEYRILYENKGDNTVKNLKIDGPIPHNTHYVGNSDSSSVKYSFLVSIDYGKTWEEEPVKRIEQLSDRTQKEVIIPPEKYTHIRWVSSEPLAPGDKQRFVYRVNLE